MIAEDPQAKIVIDMRCPRCGDVMGNIIEKRDRKDHIYRRKICRHCGNMFSKTFPRKDASVLSH